MTAEVRIPTWPSRSLLKAVVAHFLAKDGQDGFRCVPIPREEEGIGILSGLAQGALVAAGDARRAKGHLRSVHST